MGWENPTRIQELAIPHVLEGKNLIGCAATGTGKTGAFLIPLVDRLGRSERCKTLVLVPTRELALQIGEQFDLLGRKLGARALCVIGGVAMGPQTHALRAGPALIVATPGRLVDHLHQGTARLDGIGLLVLDEADRMLDMGFAPALDRILKQLPKERQTLLFSATLGPEVDAFSKRHLKAPTKVEVTRSGTTAAGVHQSLFRATKEEKLALLLALLEEGEQSTLVFTRTKHGADKVARRLDKEGHDVARIHGDRSQGQRQSALEGFRTGKVRILVATDIAARGIDVEEIGQVINFDLPHVPEDYVHRIGRTARAGAEGVAISFSTPDDTDSLRAIEKLIGKPIERRELPREAPAFQRELERAREAQRSPGPQQPGHGTSTRRAARVASFRANGRRRRG